MPTDVIRCDDDENVISLRSTPSPSHLDFADDLLPLPAYKSAATLSTDIDGLLPSPIRLHEDLSNGCGGQTWPAGMLLAKHMLRYHGDKLRTSKM